VFVTQVYESEQSTLRWYTLRCNKDRVLQNGTSTQFALVAAGHACLLGLAAAGPESQVLAMPAGTGLRRGPAVSGGFSDR
jgi:hypothetical protein